MVKGEWSRWGRGSAEGYGFEIGDILRYSVTRVRAIGGDRYEARLNAAMLVGSFATLDEAEEAVEASATCRMMFVTFSVRSRRCRFHLGEASPQSANRPLGIHRELSR